MAVGAAAAAEVAVAAAVVAIEEGVVVAASAGKLTPHTQCRSISTRRVKWPRRAAAHNSNWPADVRSAQRALFLCGPR